MPRRRVTFAELRPAAGLFMLALFVLAVQLAPLAHLVSHRNDHTHRGERFASSHLAAHRAGVVHEHEGPRRRLTAAERGWSPEHQSPPDAPPPAETNDDGDQRDHGRGSSAHFGLALISGPAVLTLPSPAGLVQALQAAALPPHLDAPLLALFSRGPPPPLFASDSIGRDRGLAAAAAATMEERHEGASLQDGCVLVALCDNAGDSGGHRAGSTRGRCGAAAGWPRSGAGA